MAFPQTDPTPLEGQDLERWASWLKDRRLETPAVLALESLKPLHNLVYQFLVFSSPLAEAVGLNAQPVLQLWDDPAQLESLISRLEPER